MSHDPTLNSYILNALPNNLDGLIILDVGCGFGEWGYLIKTRKQGAPYVIGIDVWQPYLEKLRKLNIYDALVQADAPLIPVRSKSVDIALACEVLEHLPKGVGRNLLKELERVTKKLILISTPLNYPQREVHGNPYQKHISEWAPEELKELDFKVKIVHSRFAERNMRINKKVESFLLIVARKTME